MTESTKQTTTSSGRVVKPPSQNNISKLFVVDNYDSAEDSDYLTESESDYDSDDESYADSDEEASDSE